MTCPECRKVVPDRFLACPDCAYRRSEAALAAFQQEPLRRVVAGVFQLSLRGKGRAHIQMFGADYCFCHEPARGQIARSLLAEIQEQETCPDCLRELRRHIAAISTDRKNARPDEP